ncbi:MAG: hypothetical protein C0616_15370 [Desulfuromonas sp.]|nr:MAG: hypothetical protein C0616_15370 [Desulfuromonas sp.]
MESFSVLSLLMFAGIGISAGFLAGLLGIGGGILLVPLFLWAFPLAGYSADILVHAAFATSLAIILPTSISSTAGHRKRGNVDWHEVKYLALGGIAGSVAGAWFASLLNGNSLQFAFGVMQILVSIKMFRSRRYLPPERNSLTPPLSLFLVGSAGGCFSAFFGVGGGVVAVPLMVIALQLPIHRAVGNSSALIVISSLSGALSYVIHGWHAAGLPQFSAGFVNLLVVFLVAPFTIVTARLGVRVAGGTSHARLLKAFSVLLILVGIKMIWQVTSAG